jgi:hypothetical protein
MYGYLVTFVIVFLTHPGVVINWFDPGVPGGLFQAAMVLVLQSPSDGKQSFADTMSIIYYVMLAIWAYIKVQILLKSAK